MVAAGTPASVVAAIVVTLCSMALQLLLQPGAVAAATFDAV